MPTLEPKQNTKNKAEKKLPIGGIIVCVWALTKANTKMVTKGTAIPFS